MQIAKTPEEIAQSLTGQARETMVQMHDGLMTWSATHSWPTVRDTLQCKGLIQRTNTDDWSPITEITALGVEVRAALAAQVSA